MAIVLKADNRGLTDSQKYSYTDDNYLSGVSVVDVTNSAGFAADSYVLFGTFGYETSEIVKVSSVDTTNHRLNLSSATKFSHAESTRVTVIPYNQVRFYWTSTATFDTDTLLSTVDVQADDFYTTYSDSSNSTGFGWFKFYNETTGAITSNSNAIPYANFSRDTVKGVLDGFYSLLNVKELNLVTEDEAMSWLNEAYSMARNELNLVNEEYGTSDETTLTVTSGTKEYSLPSDFANVVSIYDGTNRAYIAHIPVRDVPEWDSVSGNTPKYYLRGGYIGLSPTPAADTSYTYRYQARTTELNSYYDTVSLPDNMSYILKDFMMFRAGQKLGRPDYMAFRENFQSQLNQMKVYSVKRDAHLDAWGIADNASV